MAEGVRFTDLISVGSTPVCLLQEFVLVGDSADS